MARNGSYWLDADAERYPPLEGDERVDVAVVGAGVTGLACAHVLARAGVRVRVVEARRVAGGASGRNGGFALRGTAIAYGRRRARETWRLSEDALVRLAELAGDAFRPVGSLFAAASEQELAACRGEREALAEDGFAVEWVDRNDLPPLLRGHFLGGLYHPLDGALEPGRWTRRLAALAAAAGARIAEETPATGLTGTTLATPRGAVVADHVVVATDGYTHGLVPELDAAIRPARAQMLATAPLAARHFACPVYVREGWDYWQQTPEGRLVIGGFRDSELEREYTRDDTPSRSIQGRIEQFLARLLGETPVVTHRWACLLGLTADLLPLVGTLPGRQGVWVSAGYSGHGNVLALACGELLAGAILARPDPRLARFDPGRLLP